MVRVGMFGVVGCVPWFLSSSISNACLPWVLRHGSHMYGFSLFVVLRTCWQYAHLVRVSFIAWRLL